MVLLPFQLKGKGKKEKFTGHVTEAFGKVKVTMVMKEWTSGEEIKNFCTAFKEDENKAAEMIRKNKLGTVQFQMGSRFNIIYASKTETDGGTKYLLITHIPMIEKDSASSYHSVGRPRARTDRDPFLVAETGKKKGSPFFGAITFTLTSGHPGTGKVMNMIKFKLNEDGKLEPEPQQYAPRELEEIKKK